MMMMLLKEVMNLHSYSLRMRMTNHYNPTENSKVTTSIYVVENPIFPSFRMNQWLFVYFTMNSCSLCTWEIHISLTLSFAAHSVTPDLPAEDPPDVCTWLVLFSCCGNLLMTFQMLCCCAIIASFTGPFSNNGCAALGEASLRHIVVTQSVKSGLSVLWIITHSIYTHTAHGCCSRGVV